MKDVIAFGFSAKDLKNLAFSNESLLQPPNSLKFPPFSTFTALEFALNSRPSLIYSMALASLVV